ncbi:MAG: hypothetical protein WKF30_12205 [Pyrinomonadaceae bacterium]
MTTTPPLTTRRHQTRQTTQSIDALPTDRKLLALVLLAVFLIGSVTTYAVRRVTGGSNKTFVAGTAAPPASAAAELPVLPPDLDAKLADAFRPDQIIALSQYADPFADRGTSSALPPFAGTGFNSLSRSQPSAAPRAPELMTRLTNWQRICRQERVAGRACLPRTSAYLLTELSPLGTIQIRGQRKKLWVYVNPERMAFNVEVGARFFDARLVDANSNGAVFMTDAGETKIVAWSDNLDLSVSPSDAPDSSHQSIPEPIPGTKQTEPKSPPEDERAAPHEGDERLPADSALRVAPSKRTPRAGELDVLQEAVRERYKKHIKPLSRLPPASDLRRSVYVPAFNFDRQPDQASSLAVNDNEFTFPIYDERPVAAPVHRAAGVKNAKQQGRETRYLKAAFTRRAADETPPIESQQTTGGGATAAAGTTPAKPRQLNTLCDATYIGEPISVETTRPLTLSDLVRTINTSFKANIVLDSDIQNLPVNLTFVDAPWNQILRTQLDLNDLDVICNENSSLVQIAKRSKIAQIQDQKRKSAAIVREVFKLRYLQPTAGGRTDLAGRVQGGAGATLQSLDEAIREILRAGGDTRAEFRRIPGRNEFLVAATTEQIAEIRGLIDRVDRPGYQVLIRALVYNVNEDKLTDIGSQIAAVVGNAGQTNLGGFTSLPNASPNSGGGTTPTLPTDGRNPGGIPTPGRNFSVPSGLQAGAPTGVFGVTTIIGTAQFAYQLTLAQNRGLINIQSRPFGVVSDGDTFDLVSGTQIPVVTAALAGGSAFGVGQVQFIEASRIARITPQVAELEDGKAGFVTLLIQLENNDIANVLYNGYPGVNRQSLQTVLRLRNNETAVIGGLSTDAVQRNQTKVPGLGDIPGLGWLFKRKFEQQSRTRLYFAIAIEVIDQAQDIKAFPAPADAITSPPPPPQAQRPSPYESSPKVKRAMRSNSGEAAQLGDGGRRETDEAPMLVSRDIARRMAEYARLLPRGVAEENDVVVIDANDAGYVVGAVDPAHFPALRNVARALRVGTKLITPTRVSRNQFEILMEIAYGRARASSGFPTDEELESSTKKTAHHHQQHTSSPHTLSRGKRLIRARKRQPKRRTTN